MLRRERGPRAAGPALGLLVLVTRGSRPPVLIASPSPQVRRPLTCVCVAGNGRLRVSFPCFHLFLCRVSLWVCNVPLQVPVSFLAPLRLSQPHPHPPFLPLPAPRTPTNRREGEPPPSRQGRVDPGGPDPRSPPAPPPRRSGSGQPSAPHPGSLREAGVPERGPLASPRSPNSWLLYCLPPGLVSPWKKKSGEWAQGWRGGPRPVPAGGLAPPRPRPLPAPLALAHARRPRPPATPTAGRARAAPPPGAPLGFIRLLCPQSTSSSRRRCPAWRKRGLCIRWLSVSWPSPAPRGAAPAPLTPRPLGCRIRPPSLSLLPRAPFSHFHADRTQTPALHQLLRLSTHLCP